MNGLKLVITFLLVLVAGYILGNILPFNLSLLPGRSITGQARLEVKLVMDNGTPLANVEVDVGEKPGPPAKGGVGLTNEAGIATFNLKPGDYVIYFNSGTFPKNLQIPELVPVQVEKNKLNEKTLILQTK